MLRVFSPKNYKLYLKSFLFAVGMYFVIDKFVMDEIEIIKSAELNDSIREFNEVVFSSILDDYEAYTEEVANIIDENADDNIFAVYAAYLFMQNNGYMSYGTKFNNGIDNPSAEIFSHLGINVAVGNGVCRHQSDNLYRVLTNLGYECERVTGEGYVGEEQGVTNHQVVYVEEKGYVYLLDPANNTVFVRCGSEEYISITNPNFKFMPRLSTDMAYGYDNNNYRVYVNLDNRIHDLEILQSRLDMYFGKAEELKTEFIAAEAIRLSQYESVINQTMQEYEELIEEIEQKKLEKGLQ